MAKTIKIVRCTLCGSTEIETDNKAHFKCKVCPFEWWVINESKDENKKKALPKKQDASEVQ